MLFNNAVIFYLSVYAMEGLETVVPNTKHMQHFQ